MKKALKIGIMGMIGFMLFVYAIRRIWRREMEGDGRESTVPAPHPDIRRDIP